MESENVHPSRVESEAVFPAASIKHRILVDENGNQLVDERFRSQLQIGPDGQSALVKVLLTQGGPPTRTSALGVANPHGRRGNVLDETGSEYEIVDTYGLRWKVRLKGVGLVHFDDSDPSPGTQGLSILPWHYYNDGAKEDTDMMGLMWEEDARHAFTYQKILAAKGIRTHISLMAAQPEELEFKGKVKRPSESPAEGPYYLEDERGIHEYALIRERPIGCEMDAMRTNTRLNQIIATSQESPGGSENVRSEIRYAMQLLKEEFKATGVTEPMETVDDYLRFGAKCLGSNVGACHRDDEYGVILLRTHWGNVTTDFRMLDFDTCKPFDEYAKEFLQGEPVTQQFRDSVLGSDAILPSSFADAVRNAFKECRVTNEELINIYCESYTRANQNIPPLDDWEKYEPSELVNNRRPDLRDRVRKQK